MSTFDYGKSKELAIRLVEKFGTECKVETKLKTQKAKIVFMSNTKADKAEGPVQQQDKKVYVAGTNLDINMNDRINVKNTVYLITSVEMYNFDNSSKILYILGISK